MNRMVASIVVVFGLLSGASSSAEAEPQAETTWYFRVDYETGQYSESRDASVAGNIIMPTGSNWTCKRNAVSLTKAGKLLAGFACFASGGWVSVKAACSPSSADEDSGSAMVGDSSTSVRLGVVCTTRMAGSPKQAPAPARSIEKNL